MFNILGFIGKVALSAITATLVTQAIFALVPLIVALLAFLTSSGAVSIIIAGGFLSFMSQVGKTRTA